MNNRLYVGNVSFQATADDLRELFSKHGTVNDVHVVTDRMTGRPRGFAFVEMDSQETAEKTAQALNGQSFMERELVVNLARPREDRGPRPGGSGGPGGPRRRPF